MEKSKLFTVQPCTDEGIYITAVPTYFKSEVALVNTNNQDENWDDDKRLPYQPGRGEKS